MSSGRPALFSIYSVGGIVPGRAKPKAILKPALRQNGYPPDMQKLATEMVLKQAEVIAKEFTPEPGYRKQFKFRRTPSSTKKHPISPPTPQSIPQANH
ncbi:type I restriction enzyme endonuclease domain-containing protein [Robiginitalea marina]|uniref:type I restriction enzyme endonuclease domain-containing protein n=1 Tax=Robiginitalea marina TaxID=2954105 RepID=UPI0035148AEF